MIKKNTALFLLYAFAAILAIILLIVFWSDGNENLKKILAIVAYCAGLPVGMAILWHLSSLVNRK